jgi:hypothetical protein
VSITKVLKANIKKKRIHVIQGPQSILQLGLNGGKADIYIYIYIQFVVIFHLLKNGKPMTIFENLKELFEFS